MHDSCFSYAHWGCVTCHPSKQRWQGSDQVQKKDLASGKGTAQHMLTWQSVSLSSATCQAFRWESWDLSARPSLAPSPQAPRARHSLLHRTRDGGDGDSWAWAVQKRGQKMAPLSANHELSVLPALLVMSCGYFAHCYTWRLWVIPLEDGMGKWVVLALVFLWLVLDGGIDRSPCFLKLHVSNTDFLKALQCNFLCLHSINSITNHAIVMNKSMTWRACDVLISNPLFTVGAKALRK